MFLQLMPYSQQVSNHIILMLPLLPDPHQARQRGSSPEKDAPWDPLLPWQPGKAAPNHGKQAAKHEGQFPAPAAAQPGPEPAGEGGARPQADQGHCRAEGEGQEDSGMEEQEGGMVADDNVHS